MKYRNSLKSLKKLGVQIVTRTRGNVKRKFVISSTKPRLKTRI